MEGVEGKEWSMWEEAKDRPTQNVLWEGDRELQKPTR